MTKQAFMIKLFSLRLYCKCNNLVGETHPTTFITSTSTLKCLTNTLDELVCDTANQLVEQGSNKNRIKLSFRFQKSPECVQAEKEQVGESKVSHLKCLDEHFPCEEPSFCQNSSWELCFFVRTSLFENSSICLKS